MRTDVHTLLDRSKALHTLPDDQRRALAHDLVRVVAFLEDPALEAQVRDQEEVRGLIGDVDFPAFVSGLIQGVFKAVVDSSVEQMRAYAVLVQGLAKSLDAFTRDAEDKDREHLTARSPQLARVVLMGIHRIVVTDGQVNARVQLPFTTEDAQDEPDDDRE